MIVIEGPDLAGKSTLAEALFKRVVANGHRHPMVRHFTKVQPHFDKYWGYQSCVARDVIMDRFHMSHVVYRHAEDVEHELTPLRYELVDAEVSRVGGIVVLLAPAPELIVKRWEALRRDEMYPLDHVLKVATHFTELAFRGLIETRTGIYKPKIDMTFTREVEVDQMVDQMVVQIVRCWLQRQEELDMILYSRQGAL